MSRIESQLLPAQRASQAIFVEQTPASGRRNGRFLVDRRDDGPTHASDERLLADFIAGDQGAFRSLVERYSPELFRFVSRFTRNVAVAEDVIQETFVQVYQSAGGFEVGRRLRPWLFTIAANKARDQLRARSRKREVPIASGGGSEDSETASYLDFLADDELAPHQVMEENETRQRVKMIIDRMPENLREVLVLGYYQRFAYKEIAEILSIPLGTVKSRLHAAVSHFATAYKKLELGDSSGASSTTKPSSDRK